MQQRPDLTELVLAHAARVRRALRRRGVAPADVPDVEQEVFIVAHRKLAELEVRSSLLGWLLGIAANVASQHRRKASHRRERVGLASDPMSEAPDPLAQLQAEERRSRMHRFLEALSAEQREVIVLHELSELSMHEVARELRVPLKTAFSRLYAAHRALRREARRESLREPGARKPRRGIGASLAAFALGFKWLPRAQAALLPLPIAALALLITAQPTSMMLTSASTERALCERALPRGEVATVLPTERQPAPLVGPPRTARVRFEPTRELAVEHQEHPRAGLIVLRVDDDYALSRLPYPHPFEERATATVDPSTIKPRIIMP